MQVMVGLKTYKENEWAKIAKEHSAKTPRMTFAEYDADSTYDNKTVIRGIQALGSGGTQITTTGFLENETGKIIAGTDAIPNNVEDR